MKTMYKVIVDGWNFQEYDSKSIAKYMVSQYREMGHTAKYEMYRKAVK